MVIFLAAAGLVTAIGAGLMAFQKDAGPAVAIKVGVPFFFSGALLIVYVRFGHLAYVEDLPLVAAFLLQILAWKNLTAHLTAVVPGRVARRRRSS